jgi:glucosamine--fructose-6-phosphate aminotransferase (isomerizing)
LEHVFGVSVASLQKGRFKTVVLTGMGSAFHAIHPLVELINHGLTAMMVETSELVHYKNRLFDPKTLIVAVSQSGRSAEVVRLLEINRGKSSIVAITNTPDSPLAKGAEAAILTRAGNEFSVSCKTYLTALMALIWLRDIVFERDLQHTRQELKTVCLAVEDYMPPGNDMCKSWHSCSKVFGTCSWLAGGLRSPPLARVL